MAQLVITTIHFALKHYNAPSPFQNIVNNFYTNPSATIITKEWSTNVFFQFLLVFFSFSYAFQHCMSIHRGQTDTSVSLCIDNKLVTRVSSGPFKFLGLPMSETRSHRENLNYS